MEKKETSSVSEWDKTIRGIKYRLQTLASDMGNETTEISSLGYFERRRSKNSFSPEAYPRDLINGFNYHRRPFVELTYLLFPPKSSIGWLACTRYIPINQDTRSWHSLYRIFLLPFWQRQPGPYFSPDARVSIYQYTWEFLYIFL